MSWRLRDKRYYMLFYPFYYFCPYPFLPYKQFSKPINESDGQFSLKSFVLIYLPIFFVRQKKKLKITRDVIVQAHQQSENVSLFIQCLVPIFIFILSFSLPYHLIPSCEPTMECQSKLQIYMYKREKKMFRKLDIFTFIFACIIRGGVMGIAEEVISFFLFFFTLTHSFCTYPSTVI